jgi:hypothetical protein
MQLIYKRKQNKKHDIKIIGYCYRLVNVIRIDLAKTDNFKMSTTKKIIYKQGNKLKDDCLKSRKQYYLFMTQFKIYRKTQHLQKVRFIYYIQNKTNSLQYNFKFNSYSNFEAASIKFISTIHLD